jgi:hypothetical protein
MKEDEINAHVLRMKEMRNTHILLGRDENSAWDTYAYRRCNIKMIL